MEKGFFKDEDIDLQFVIVGGGAVTEVALMAGNAEFLATASRTPAAIVARHGRKILVTNAFDRALTFQMVGSNRMLKKAKLGPKASIKDKLRALKGTTIGVPSVGGVSDMMIRYFLQNVGGLRPNDFKFVRVGFGVAVMVAGIQSGTIDGFGASPPGGPVVVGRGLGQILASGWDIPELSNMAYEVLVTRTEYAREHPDIVAKMTRAMARGTNFTANYPEESARLIRRHFRGMEIKTLTDSIRTMLPAFGNSGRMTEKMWANAMKFWRATGVKDIDIREDGFWTNRFIKDIPKD